MAAPGVQLIPSPEEIMQILKRTGAFREGHFVYPNGKHTAHYFQMPLAFRYYDTARVLAVALSRKFRVDRDIASQLPKVSIISPSSGGIPVAFGVRDALSAQQIYWAEQENGQRMFRQYVNQGDIAPCIIVDDIIRSGHAIEETVELIMQRGGWRNRYRLCYQSKVGASKWLQPSLRRTLIDLRDQHVRELSG